MAPAPLATCRPGVWVGSGGAAPGTASCAGSAASSSSSMLPALARQHPASKGTPAPLPLSSSVPRATAQPPRLPSELPECMPTSAAAPPCARPTCTSVSSSTLLHSYRSLCNEACRGAGVCKGRDARRSRTTGWSAPQPARHRRSPAHTHLQLAWDSSISLPSWASFSSALRLLLLHTSLQQRRRGEEQPASAAAQGGRPLLAGSRGAHPQHPPEVRDPLLLSIDVQSALAQFKGSCEGWAGRAGGRAAGCGFTVGTDQGRKSTFDGSMLCASCKRPALPPPPHPPPPPPTTPCNHWPCRRLCVHPATPCIRRPSSPPLAASTRSAEALPSYRSVSFAPSSSSTSAVA